MNPSNEDGKATGIGETIEGVVATVDAMTSAVDAMEAMVMAVEMREWLEVGRPETERTTAIHFFSRALAVQKQKDGKFPHYVLPLYWPGLLPGLAQLLADCLLPHNSKAIQSGAMLSIKYLIVDYHHREEVSSHASDPLLRLVRETDCTEIRDQAVWLLGRMAWAINTETMWVKGFLPLLIDTVRTYAAISEPTKAEISSLNTAIKALTRVHRLLESYPSDPEPSWKPHLLETLPVLIGIFQEPGNSKKTQIRAGEFLEELAWKLDGNIFLENGMIGMLLEMVRVGKETTAVLLNALRAISDFLHYNNADVNSGMVYVKNALDMGALDVFHLALKRPDDRFKGWTLWTNAISCLSSTIGYATGENLEAVLSKEGLVELVLDRALGMEMSEETREHFFFLFWTATFLRGLARHCSESQMRRLILKGPLFRLLHRYLNWAGFRCQLLNLTAVQECLERSSVANRRTIRRLLDSSGITDDIRRISFAVPQAGNVSEQITACHILDTYLTNPLPPLPTHNLPSIIYTRNVPS